MIVQGRPELGLQQHQQEAYKKVKEAYTNKEKASVVMPTGCGKTFVALQLMVDNRDKNILFMAPTNAIKYQMYNYIAKYIVGEEPSSKRPARMIADEYFPNFKIMLYPSLLRVKDKQMEKLNADIIIMDELHRTGADKWGKRVNTLLEKNPKAKILGLTATPDRMDDKNVVDELFEGEIDYELTLVDALSERIVKVPEYVKCDYALKEYLEGIREAIDSCDDEIRKSELEEKYEKMRRIVEQSYGIPELLEKNIKVKDGKYIIFCRDKRHMDELISKAEEWFGAIDESPEIYSVFSGEGYTQRDNKKSIEEFESSKTGHLKLLYSIEMLNEGLHIEDISGVIMARPTESRIVYLQQLGRALYSDPTKEKTIVFDLVNNYLRNNLDREINRKIKQRAIGIKNRDDDNDKDINADIDNDAKSNSSETESEIEEIEAFRILGETREFLELLEEVTGIINQSNYLTNARAIKKWIEESGETKSPSSTSRNEEEKRLGNALSTIRHRLIKPFLELKTEEERERFREEHPEIDEVMEIIEEIDRNGSSHLRNARKIKEWIEESGETKTPSSTSKNEQEKRLGGALKNIRYILIKPFLELKTEEEREKYREEHPEIDEVMEIIEEIDRNNIPTNLANARAIKKWIEESGETKPPSSNSKNEEEKRLGIALSNIRHHLIKPFLELKTEEEREKYREEHPEIDEVMEIINEIDKNNISPYLRNARAIKEWIEQLDRKKKPSQYSKNKEEKRLHSALKNIRKFLIKPYMNLKTEEEREKYREEHPEIDEVLEIISNLDMQYGTKKQKELAVLIRQDIEKRNALQEAKKLEQDYEKQLSAKKGENTQDKGVDFNEQ